MERNVTVGKERSAVPMAVLLALPFWVGAVGLGFWIFGSYQSKPGDLGLPPEPLTLRAEFPSKGGCPCLLLFVHPHCPCSRASLSELSLIVEQCKTPLSAYVIFVTCEEDPEESDPTSLQETADKIPRVKIRLDRGGKLAAKLGAKTSGHTMLVDAEGTTIFRGGITRIRGHAGDNAGRRSILALLHGEVAETHSTNVFGCPLSSQINEVTQGEAP